MKVVGYIRVSTPIQASEGESLRTQKESIKQFAKGKGWHLSKIYADEGISGCKVENRPDFIKMIHDAENGKFNGIVFSRLSRFARNTSDFLNYQKKLSELGIMLFSIKESIDPTTNTGKLFMGLLALIAEWEREAIREQMAENKMARWADNRTFIGKPPFGYRWNSELHKLEINDREAAIYKRVVSMYCDLGLSFKVVALRLKNEGVKCKKKFFSSVTISYILKNPAYYGHYVLNKYKYIHDEKSNRFRRSKELKPESQHITFPIPPIISKTEWDRIQEKVKFNTVKSKRSSSVQEDYWLRDLLICGECGGKIKPHHGSKRKDGTFPRYYTCYWSTASPQTLSLHERSKCKLPFIKAKTLESSLWQELMKPLVLGHNKEKLSALIDPKKHEKNINLLSDKIASMEKQIHQKEKAKRRLYSLYEEDGFNKNELKQRLILNQNEMLEIRAILNENRLKHLEFKEIKEKDSVYKEFLNNKKSLLKKLARDLLNLKPADKKRFIESIIKGKITITLITDDYGRKSWKPDGWDIKFNFAILQDLIDQGKIGVLDNNSSHNSAAADF